MSRNRFVSPETVRVDLSDGDWIEVKKRLAFGERSKLQTMAFTNVNANGALTGKDAEIGLDFERYAIARISMWVTEWSFRDAQGRPVEISQSAIRSLDEDTAEEITKALDAHIEAMEAEKKGARGTS